MASNAVQTFQGLNLNVHETEPGVWSVSVPAIEKSQYIKFTPDPAQTLYAQAQSQAVEMGVLLDVLPPRANVTDATRFRGIAKELEQLSPSATPDQNAAMLFQLVTNGEIRLAGKTTVPPVTAAMKRELLRVGSGGASGGASGAAASAASSGRPIGGPDLDDDGGSGALAASVNQAPAPVTLQRTTRPLTRDVALWLLIKRNADAVSWTNYNDALNFLFDCSTQPDTATAPTGRWRDLITAATSLSHRRFLPFTDTDAYRALKVATEAFVTTYGGIAPTLDDWSDNSRDIILAMESDANIRYLAEERLGIKMSSSEIKTMSNSYVDPIIPYLKRVVDNLEGSGVTSWASALLEEFQQRGTPATNNDCDCGSLWLDCLGKTNAEKMNQPPLIELIWSYWMEEGGLIQSMNAVGLRFQNMSTRQNDPLASLEIDPLRPLNNLLWGFIQDDQHRLTIERRAYEYSHHYGFNLVGKAVPNLRPADNRSRFVEAFHILMGLCVEFFRQMDDTTVVADGFPILNALREVHLLLSQGAHNQFRDLPTTARIEMMMQQWLLGRPEFREFLPRRNMVALPEPWMHSVESMKKLQGWGDGNTFQFWQLATTGEQVLASIRYGNWNMITDANNAANWANFFRPEIQTYIHAYRAVTGVDIASAEPADPRVPSLHLNRRQRQTQRLHP